VTKDGPSGPGTVMVAFYRDGRCHRMRQHWVYTAMYIFANVGPAPARRLGLSSWPRKHSGGWPTCARARPVMKRSGRRMYSQTN
jgi:hypothetical protein